MAEVTSTFQKRPAYRYIRNADKLPKDAPHLPAEKIICKVRLFNPTGTGTWWLASYDPGTGIAYGVADVLEREAGDIYIPELVEYRDRRFGLPIERDLHYTPQAMAAILAGGRR